MRATISSMTTSLGGRVVVLCASVLGGSSARSPSPSPPHAPATTTDTEVLVGVLADLHAKGLLTADELAAKIAKLTSAT